LRCPARGDDSGDRVDRWRSRHDVPENHKIGDGLSLEIGRRRKPIFAVTVGRPST